MIWGGGLPSPHIISPPLPSPHNMLPTCSQHVHDLFLACSRYVQRNVHELLNEMFMTSSPRVHDMFTTSSPHVYHMFTTCSPHVHYMFTTCSSHILTTCSAYSQQITFYSPMDDDCPCYND